MAKRPLVPIRLHSVLQGSTRERHVRPSRDAASMTCHSRPTETVHYRHYRTSDNGLTGSVGRKHLMSKGRTRK